MAAPKVDGEPVDISMQIDNVDCNNHPMLKKILDKNGGNRMQGEEAFQVYLDLVEAKGWCGVDVRLCEAPVLLVLHGRSSETSASEAIIPVPANANLSHAVMQQCIDVVEQELSIDRTIFAFLDSDSTVVYYRATRGLTPPDPPELLEQKRQKRQQKLHKRRKQFVSREDVTAAIAS